MIQTKIETLWLRQCCAFHLQYFPDTPLLSKLCDLQNRIEQQSTAPLLRVPLQSLHMTVVTLIDARSQFRVPNHEVWKLEGARRTEIIDRLVEKTPPVDLEFSEVATSEAAVFIKAKEPPELHRLRAGHFTCHLLRGLASETTSDRPHHAV